MEEQKNDDKSITLKTSTLWKIGTFVFLGLFIISLMTGGFGIKKSNEITGAVVQPTAPSAPTAPTPTVKVTIDKDDPVLGDPKAEISIVEFSDFQCPFCERAFTGAIKDLKESSYFKNGEVNLVFKQLPLTSIHPFAQKAAEASVCAYKQGKFWEYHDTLFENQAALDVASLKKYAADLKLDTKKFDTCLDNGEAVDKVTKDTNLGTSAGVRGTPFFAIMNKDGETQTISGAYPFANFETAIKALQ